MLGLEERFVSLNIDVNSGVVELGDGVEAVGSGGEVRRGHLDGPGVGGCRGRRLRRSRWRRGAGRVGGRRGQPRRPRRAWGVRRWCVRLCGRAGWSEAGGDDSECGGFVLCAGLSLGAESSMIGDGCAEVVLLLFPLMIIGGAVSPHRRCIGFTFKME